MDSLSLARVPLGAPMFGWQEPYPDREPNAELRNEVEAHANRLHATDFDVLTDEERVEFKALAKAARDYANERLTAESSSMAPKR